MESWRRITRGARLPRSRKAQNSIAANGSRIGSIRRGSVVNGSGRIVATRDRIEKNDPAAMNSAKHIRHK